MANEKVNKIITDTFIKAMENGVVPWERPWHTMEPRAWNGRPYRGINQLLLSLAGRKDEEGNFVPFTDNRYITFKKCAELGGNVKKGEHGHLVVFWKFLPAKGTKDSDDKSSQKTIPFLRYYNVFNVEQCENLDLPELEIPMLDFEPIDEADAIVNNWSNKPEIIHGGDSAYFAPRLDKIGMPIKEMFKSVQGYYSTLFHELIHSTGHESRLARFQVSDILVHEKYSKEELVAELGASFLRVHCHIDSDELRQNSTSYIHGWMTEIRKDPALIVSAAGKAQKAFDHILGIKFTEESTKESAELVTA